MCTSMSIKIRYNVSGSFFKDFFSYSIRETLYVSRLYIFFYLFYFFSFKLQRLSLSLFFSWRVFKWKRIIVGTNSIRKFNKFLIMSLARTLIGHPEQKTKIQVFYMVPVIFYIFFFFCMIARAHFSVFIFICVLSIKRPFSSFIPLISWFCYCCCSVLQKNFNEFILFQTR